ncbi:hypothetical protein CRG98_021556 [Punica granatum]|uniref:Uncharacterized protein n=1 Tax=Punica granatum TaxID=22663 RepID=A0A2I0JQ84_PUNGR|nr:hypothetical protein CRG98_021556 [Punica granatum]
MRHRPPLSPFLSLSGTESIGETKRSWGHHQPTKFPMGLPTAFSGSNNLFKVVVSDDDGTGQPPVSPSSLAGRERERGGRGGGGGPPPPLGEVIETPKDSR